MPAHLALMSASSALPSTLAASGEDFWVGVMVIVIIWSVFSFVHRIVKTTSRERTRREIAAYIAEGSITPEQGERLMKAGKGIDEA